MCVLLLQCVKCFAMSLCGYVTLVYIDVSLTAFMQLCLSETVNVPNSIIKRSRKGKVNHVTFYL